MTLSPDGKWMWDGSNWIPAPPQEDPEELIEQPVVETQPEPTAALPAGQPPTSISANPLAMDDNTTIVGGNIFQKPIIYAIPCMLLLLFAAIAYSKAGAYEDEARSWHIRAYDIPGSDTVDCDDTYQNFNQTMEEEEECQYYRDMNMQKNSQAELWFIYSYTAFTLSLISLGYGGYLQYNSRKNK